MSSEKKENLKTNTTGSGEQKQGAITGIETETQSLKKGQEKKCKTLYIVAIIAVIVALILIITLSVTLTKSNDNNNNGEASNQATLSPTTHAPTAMPVPTSMPTTSPTSLPTISIYEYMPVYEQAVPGEPYTFESGNFTLKEDTTYLNVSTFKSCNFYYDENSTLLNSSYIEVYGDEDGNTTYTVDGLIVTDIYTYSLLPSNCTEPNLKIINISYNENNNLYTLYVNSVSFDELFTDIEVDLNENNTFAFSDDNPLDSTAVEDETYEGEGRRRLGSRFRTIIRAIGRFFGFETDTDYATFVLPLNNNYKLKNTLVDYTKRYGYNISIQSYMDMDLEGKVTLSIKKVLGIITKGSFGISGSIGFDANSTMYSYDDVKNIADTTSEAFSMSSYVDIITRSTSLSITCASLVFRIKPSVAFKLKASTTDSVKLVTQWTTNTDSISYNFQTTYCGRNCGWSITYSSSSPSSTISDMNKVITSISPSIDPDNTDDKCFNATSNIYMQLELDFGLVAEKRDFDITYTANLIWQNQNRLTWPDSCDSTIPDGCDLNQTYSKSIINNSYSATIDTDSTTSIEVYDNVKGVNNSAFCYVNFNRFDYKDSWARCCAPTSVPTLVPTKVPTFAPTKIPTSVPTRFPTKVPTTVPTKVPTMVPTKSPTNNPSNVPTKIPTAYPTTHPTLQGKVIVILMNSSYVDTNVDAPKLYQDIVDTVNIYGSNNVYIYNETNITKFFKENSYQYSGIDTLVIPKLEASLSFLSSAKLQALRDFVNLGGNMVVMGDTLGYGTTFINSTFGLGWTTVQSTTSNLTFYKNTGSLYASMYYTQSPSVISGYSFWLTPSTVKNTSDIIYNETTNNYVAVATHYYGTSVGAISWIGYNYGRTGQNSGTSWRDIVYNAMYSSRTSSPTASPTFNPTITPSSSPTLYPTNSPTNAPTIIPTSLPSYSPTNLPTKPPKQVWLLTDTNYVNSTYLSYLTADLNLITEVILTSQNTLTSLLTEDINTYSNVDAIIIPFQNAGIYNSLTELQNSTLRQFVTNGGKLILIGDGQNYSIAISSKVFSFPWTYSKVYPIAVNGIHVRKNEASTIATDIFASSQSEIGDDSYDIFTLTNVVTNNSIYYPYFASITIYEPAVAANYYGTGTGLVFWVGYYWPKQNVYFREILDDAIHN